MRIIAVSFMLHNCGIDNGEGWHYDHRSEGVSMIESEADNWYSDMKKVYNSFVVGRDNFDDQQDVRQKKIQMVREKGILRPNYRDRTQLA